MSGTSRTSSSGLWTLIKLLLIIFALTACYTADLVRNDPRQLFTAILVWVCVIVGIVVAFMGLSYWATKDKMPDPYKPYYQNSNPQAYPVPVYNPGPIGPRPCRYCNAYLTGVSPICPVCGRKN